MVVFDNIHRVTQVNMYTFDNGSRGDCEFNTSDL